ncbi:MAG: Flp pilus assembly complex ATPase component TadA [Elusimicrobia bacterium]|nr:Flp pilus assembly complex ATPase component TadA [Elusimicrobiota bacterium]
MAVKGLVRRKTVLEVLKERKLLDEEQLKKADELAKKDNKTLQQVIVETGLMKKPKLLKALSEEWQVKAVDVSQMELDKEVVGIIPEAVARRHHAVPFAKEESVLFVAMADPKDFFVSEDLHLRTGLDIQAYLAMPWDILAALDATYGRGEGTALGKLMEDVKRSEDAPPELSGDIAKDAPKSDIAEVDASAPEVEKWVNAIFLAAIQGKASDIHIEPIEDPNGKNSRVLLRFRQDGFLKPGPFNIPWSYRHAISAKLKILTNSMNLTERRIPQSGRIQILAGGNPIEFRVEIVPTVYGESAVLRILDRRSIQVDIHKMGFLEDTKAKLLGLLQGIGGKKNFGLILVCGPTGSGKSTTLYSCLNYINRPDIKILTAENPVEYNLDGIVQVPVNPDLKLGENKKFDFAAALRSFLRLDPDVIMVGEIRDEETAHIAMEAAMTGHLVFSTIHTNDSSSTLSRVIEMGVPTYMVAGTMKAILAQRLGRRICGDCAEEVDPTPDELAVFKEQNVAVPAGTRFKRGKGCDTCKNSGFKGRVGFHELLVMSDSIRKETLTDASALNIQTHAMKEGLRTIMQDGLEKVKMGQTTVREVLGGAEEEKK